jgi:hypothetical protein
MELAIDGAQYNTPAQNWPYNRFDYGPYHGKYKNTHSVCAAWVQSGDILLVTDPCPSTF